MMLRRLLPKKIAVDTAILAPEIWISGSDKQLYQVLLNLGINAGDAMPDGGELLFKVYIEHRFKQNSPFADHESQFAVIEVKDTGMGIPPDIQQRVFEPFFTTKGVGKGTGLGLAIVHGIVNAHDGFVELHSEVGKGTTFKLFLPLINKVAPSEEPLHAESRQAIQATILVVDDESYLRKMLVRILRKQGYSVLEAADGEEALNLFEKKRKEIDLIVSDMGMPKIDGLQLLKKIRRRRKKMKGVIMTGYLDSKAAEQIEKESITVVSKPFDTDKFTETIYALLKK